MKKLLHENCELSVRLAGYATAAGAIVALAPSVFGQVEYSGIQNIQVNNPGTFNLDINGDVDIDFEFVVDGSATSNTLSAFYLMFYFGNIVNPVSGTYANSWILGSDGMVEGLNAASVIDSSLTAWTNYSGVNFPGALGIYSTSSGSVNTYGDFLGQEKYIGVQFFIGPDQHYGWIRASMTPDAKQLTLHDWAYQITPGAGITVSDITRPIPTMTLGVPSPTSVQDVTVNVNFNELVQGLTLEDFIISNGNATGLTTITPGLEYTLEVSAILNGTVKVTLPAGAVTDNSLNDNEESITSWLFDNTGPVITFDTGIPGATNQPSITLGMSFNEEVFGMELGDLVVTNGSAANLIEVTPNLEYTVEITATVEGEVTVELPATTVSDITGNDNTSGSTSWEYDGTAPVAVLDAGVSGSTTEQTVTVAVNFSETIEGLIITDFSATNGNISNLIVVTAGTAYTIDLTAVAGGVVSLELPAGSVTDEAGNENAAASVSYTWESGVALEDITDNLVSLYPNPVGDHLTIELKQEAKITITFMTGQVALIKENVLKDMIDVSGLSGGIYLIHIETSNDVNTYKFIKE